MKYRLHSWELQRTTQSRKTNNTHRRNSINAWIKGTQTAEEIEAIQYGAQIPDKYKSKVLKDYETAMGACKA